VRSAQPAACPSSAKFWQKVLADLRNRGVKDILIACFDGWKRPRQQTDRDTVGQPCVRLGLDLPRPWHPDTSSWMTNQQRSSK
jgi:hypothetical protein